MPGFYDKSCYKKNERNYWKQQSISYITAHFYQEWNIEEKKYMHSAFKMSKNDKF